MPYSDREKKREWDRRYKELNKEKIREKKAEYRRVNKEKIAEYRRVNKEKISKYRELNKEKIREKKAEYYQLNKKKIRGQRAEYRKEARIKCREYLGGKCVKCGSIHNLQFDHIDRTTKKYTIASRVTNNFTILKEELDKCQLLCVPCHLKKTAKEWADITK